MLKRLQSYRSYWNSSFLFSSANSAVSWHLKSPSSSLFLPLHPLLSSPPSYCLDQHHQRHKHFETACITAASVTITLPRQSELLQEPPQFPHLNTVKYERTHSPELWLAAFLFPSYTLTSQQSPPLQSCVSPVRFMAAVFARGRASSPSTTSPLSAPEPVQPRKRYFKPLPLKQLQSVSFLGTKYSSLAFSMIATHFLVYVVTFKLQVLSYKLNWQSKEELLHLFLNTSPFFKPLTPVRLEYTFLFSVSACFSSSLKLHCVYIRWNIPSLPLQREIF